MSQAQLSFIGKIKNWLKSLVKAKEEVLETLDTVDEVLDTVEAVATVVAPKKAKKIKDISKTIDETIAAVRGTEVVLDKAANLTETVLDIAETTFKKGRFEVTEIATITNAITMAGELEVDWNNLSKNLNRDVKSIKAKAKLLSK